MSETPHNILVVHGNNDLYGADRILLDLLTRLDRARFRPIVVLPTDTQHINRLSPRLAEAGIETIFLPMGVMRRRYLRAWKLPGFAWDVLAGARRLERIIRERQIALVQTNTNTILSGALAARWAKVPHLWSVHEITTSPGWVRRTLHFLIPRLSARVVTVSRAVRDHMLRDAPRYASRFQYVRGGIDLQPFLNAPGRARVRKEWGIGEEEVLVGMVGRVTTWKGQPVFAEAAKQLLDQHRSLKMVAVGGVFDTEAFRMQAFRDQVRKLGIEGRFLISDFRSDMPDVYAALDVFALPSTQPEPFGLVVIEAMASAKPVVATSPGGPSETVVDGETGYLVPPSDPTTLASALEKLVSDPELRARIGAAGRKRACELFGLARYVGEFEELYGQLLDRAGARPMHRQAEA
jgi:glycosyltransferase involved in cell wall biosynthesis